MIEIFGFVSNARSIFSRPPISLVTLSDGRHAPTCSSQAANAFFGLTTNRLRSSRVRNAYVARASVVFPAPGTENVAPFGRMTNRKTFFSWFGVKTRLGDQ